MWAPALFCRDVPGSEMAVTNFRLFTDSLKNKIYAFDYEDGKVTGKHDFVDCLSQGLPGGTFPDGLCIDNGGGVWSARFVLLQLHP